MATAGGRTLAIWRDHSGPNAGNLPTAGNASRIDQSKACWDIQLRTPLTVAWWSSKVEHAMQIVATLADDWTSVIEGNATSDGDVTPD